MSTSSPGPTDADPHAAPERVATFRFHGELTDLTGTSEQAYRFTGTPSVKDAVEALGVPHVEVDGLRIGGAAAGFEQLLGGGENVDVYPRGYGDLPDAATRLLPALPEPARFVLDVHLGTLARYLRMLGFDARYRNDYADAAIARLSAEEDRIVLTRDLGLLKRSTVRHGRWLRATDPDEQIREVVHAFDLAPEVRPFTRCMACNGVLQPATAREIAEDVPGDVAATYDTFHRCPACGRVYWPGSHFDRMQRFVRAVLDDVA